MCRDDHRSISTEISPRLDTLRSSLFGFHITDSIPAATMSRMPGSFDIREQLTRAPTQAAVERGQATAAARKNEVASATTRLLKPKVPALPTLMSMHAEAQPIANRAGNKLTAAALQQLEAEDTLDSVHRLYKAKKKEQKG